VTSDGYVRPLDADPEPSELGRELHMNGVHTHCPAACLTMWDDDGNDREAEREEFR
jgi:hypothetical protein